jgi:hypothetical protein
MTAATLLGGGELLTGEAAVSAILLVSLDPGSSPHFTANRIVEGLIGGAVSLAVSSLFFPPDPALLVGRTAQAVFSGLGGALEQLAAALETRDAEAGAAALAAARQLDGPLVEFGESLRTGRETARLAPRRRGTRGELDRYAASFAQVDFAVRDTRVLARHALRALRSAEPLPMALPAAVRELGHATWELAGAYERPERSDAAGGHALRAGALAREAAEAGPGEDARQAIGQVRSTAVDLRRAAGLVAGTADRGDEAPTEDLLAPAE